MKRGQIIAFTGAMQSGKSLSLIRAYNESLIAGDICIVYTPTISKDGSFIQSRFPIMQCIKDKDIQNLCACNDKCMMKDQGVFYCQKSKKMKVPAISVSSSADLFNDFKSKYKSHKRISVFCDEVQLLDSGILSVIEDIAYNGVDIYISLLDLDFRGLPFQLKSNNASTTKQVSSTDILGVASTVNRNFARCMHKNPDGSFCGRPANRTQRFKDFTKTRPSAIDDELIIIDPDVYIPACTDHHIVEGKHKELLD